MEQKPKLNAKAQNRQRSNEFTRDLATHIGNVWHMGRDVGFVGRHATSKQCALATKVEGVQCTK